MFALLIRLAGDVDQWLGRDVFLVGKFRLFAKFASIAEEQNSFYPFGFNKTFG